MNPTTRSIAVDLADLHRGAELRTALVAHGWQITPGENSPDRIAPACVIVTDRMLEPTGARPQDLGQIYLLSATTTGTQPITIQVLPANASCDEVVRTAELLAEIVRLRQQVRALNDHQAMWRDQALHDPLTTLLNRRGWDQQLAYAWNPPRSVLRPWAIAMVDVDRLKQLNDSQGHDAGDTTLREIARVLRNGLRPGDVVARIGGDEFALLLTNIEPAHLPIVLDRLRRRAAEVTTLSIGAVSIDAADQRPLNRLCAAADAALLDAKRLGRDRMVIRAL